MFHLAVALLSALVSVAALAASNPPERASSVSRFFSWSTRPPDELRAAIDEYEKGRLFDAAAAADRGLGSPDTEGFRDELLLVRGLALADLGWRKEAAESFAGVLEMREPSPYYPLALLGLVECHHRDGRFEAVAETYHRYFERPWRGASRRDKLIRNFLTAYGEIRTSKLRLDNDEADLLGKPAKLAERLTHRKERPSERLLYLCGLDLFRIKDYAASLEALERIGIAGFYFPYALYTGAQDLYALDRLDEARAKLALLMRYPPLARVDHALSDRAGLFLVQLLFDAGRVDDALEASREVDGDGRYALAARLFRAEIYLATDQPSLALAFYQDLRDQRLGPRLDAQRALDLGTAYSKLGDLAAAGASLKAAVDEVSEARSGFETPGAEPRIAELRTRIEQSVSAERRTASADRKRLAAGVRRVLTFKGPLNFGKLVRVVFAPHRNTILGEPVYDVGLLAKKDRAATAEPAAGDELWFAYLQSSLRPGIEAATSVRLGLDEAKTDRDRALSALDALLGALEGRYPVAAPDDDSEIARLATGIAGQLGGAGETGVALHAEPGAPLAAEVTASRRRLLESLAADPENSEVDPALVEQARDAAARRLDGAVSFALGRLADGQAEELRHLEFQLRAELSQTLAKQSGIAHSSAGTESP